MNSYNIYNKENYGTILYHAIARDEDEVLDLANETGVNINGLVVDLERANVKDELGRDFMPRIESAVVI